MFDPPVKKISPLAFTAQIIVFLLTIALSFQLFFSADGMTLLDYINRIIHESGHILFVNWGQFMYILGGSLVQILVPLSFVAYFLFMHKKFSSGFSFFWLGNNLCTIARYIMDARVMQLELDGSRHDWNWLLGSIGLLGFDQIIGSIFFALGALCVFGGLVVMYTMIIWEVKDIKQQKN